MTKTFFPDNVDFSSKNLWKMISADVSYNKSNNNKNKRSGGSVLQIFMR